MHPVNTSILHLQLHSVFVVFHGLIVKQCSFMLSCTQSITRCSEIMIAHMIQNWIAIGCLGRINRCIHQKSEQGWSHSHHCFPCWWVQCEDWVCWKILDCVLMGDVQVDKDQHRREGRLTLVLSTMSLLRLWLVAWLPVGVERGLTAVGNVMSPRRWWREG